MLAVVIAIAVVAVVALVLTRPEGSDVALARMQTAAAIAHAKIVESDNRILKLARDSALERAAQAEKDAVRHAQNLAVAKSKLFKAALSAPDTCAPVVLAAQIAIAEADSVIDARTRELAEVLVAQGKDAKRADAAEDALRKLREPAAVLVQATKPNLWKKLRPELFVGAVAGIDATGKPNAVAGVGLGWKF
jgi:hypothetical protein